MIRSMTFSNKLSLAIFGLLSFMFFFSPMLTMRAQAQEDCSQLGTVAAIDACTQRNIDANADSPCNLNESFLGLPTWYKYLDTETDPTGRCSPTIDSTRSALPIGIAVLEGAIRLAGLVAVVMIFIAGFRFITSQGNPENAKSARMTAINALIGLVIVMISTAVVSYIGRNIGV